MSPALFTRMTFVLARAATYATLFVGLLLVFLPRRILQASGIVPPTSLGLWEVAGILVGVAGGALALWCILAFATVGKGTPAPFDPPRRLVVVGPYRYVRNPMYIGAGLAHIPIRSDDHETTRRSEEHTSELQSHHDLVCRLLLEKKNKTKKT